MGENNPHLNHLRKLSAAQLQMALTSQIANSAMRGTQITNSVPVTSQSINQPALAPPVGFDMGSNPAVSAASQIFANETSAQKTLAQMQLELLRASTVGVNPYLSLLCYSAAAAASGAIFPQTVQPKAQTIGIGNTQQLANSVSLAQQLANLTSQQNNHISLANVLTGITQPPSTLTTSNALFSSSLNLTCDNILTQSTVKHGHDTKLTMDSARPDLLLAPVVSTNNI